ncbi:hypothetical protein ACHAXT_006042 [Thalassiosira profunda]
MPSYHAATAAARHGRRTALSRLQSPSPLVTSGARRYHRYHLGAPSAYLILDGSMQSSTMAAASPASMAASQIPFGAARMGSSTSNSGDAHMSRGYNLALLASAASIAAAGSLLSSPVASCEAKEEEGSDALQTAAGLADESEEANGSGANVSVQDGMDAGPESPGGNGTPGPAEADEDTNAHEDEDDLSNDEETTCSICLINRQGPCRKYWLKFERCMKEHSAEQAKAERAKKKAEEAKEKEEGEIVATSSTEGVDVKSLEEEWDAFMVKSIQPGEDDDDDDDDEEEDDEDEEEDDEEGVDADDAESTNTSRPDDNMPAKEEVTLAERCDQFMLPWIGCIQEHRNVYSLISNAFYQKDYIDPLEDTIPDGRRACFAASRHQAGYPLLKFDGGVEIDLGNWREHVEADADEANGELEEEEPTPKPPIEEPHLINAYAKFRLTDPNSGRPIEVAYVKDQAGRLLGFDSFSKRDDSGGGDDDGTHEKGGVGGMEATAAAAHEGECTFHIVPGETTSVTAYAIYRGMAEGVEGSVREDFLYVTKDVPLPGATKPKNEE